MRPDLLDPWFPVTYVWRIDDCGPAFWTWPRSHTLTPNEVPRGRSSVEDTRPGLWRDPRRRNPQILPERRKPRQAPNVLGALGARRPGRVGSGEVEYRERGGRMQGGKTPPIRPGSFRCSGIEENRGAGVVCSRPEEGRLARPHRQAWRQV